MNEPEVSVEGMAYYLSRHVITEYWGSLLLLALLATGLPVIVHRALRTQRATRLSAAALVLVLSLPWLAALQAVWFGYRNHCLSIHGELMKPTELADVGTFLCTLLWFGLLAALPGYVTALALSLRRALGKEETA